MTILYIIAIAAASFAVILTAYQLIRRATRPSLLDRAQAIPRSNRSQDYFGFRFWREDGVTIGPRLQNAIEDGLVRAFRKAECAGYSLGLNPESYTIIFLKGVRDAAGNPAFSIPAGDYRGTEWDQGDGTILAAGQVIDVEKGWIAIPAHTAADYDNLARIIEYEAEHVILYQNDRAKYEQTKFHIAGSGHPLIPECGPRP